MCEFCNSMSGYKKEKVEKGMRNEYRVKIATKRIRNGAQVSTETRGPSYELNYCPECGKKLSKLRACPFCGQEVAEVQLDPYKIYVVCNYHEGGCGATSGYYHSTGEAIEAWNRRAGE